MQALSSTSQRRSHAAKFGAALRRAMTARGVSKLRLAEATGIPKSNLGYFLAARNLPTVQGAKLLAEALHADELVEIAIAGRTVTCGRPGCHRTFLYEGGKPKVYCSEDCASIARKLAAGDDEFDAGGRRLYDVVRAELEDAKTTGGAVRRQSLEVGLAAYIQSDSKRHARFSTYQRRVDGLLEAIDTMCRSCEPEGLCQTAECPLRAFSPLPLEGAYSRSRAATEPRKPEGAWGPTNRPRMLERIRAANATRWDRPGERERAREAMETRYQQLTADEKLERGRRISAGIDREKRSAASTRVHAERRARKAASAAGVTP